MSDALIEVGDGFWNIRGSFRIAGLLDIGTQCSLVQRNSGGFLLLDAYTLKGSVKREVDRMTDNGKQVEAIINLHPFHTVHVEKAHQQFPGAKLYGTARHLLQAPKLPWQAERSETDVLHERFAAELEFSVPAGVDFISADDNVHFSSVLAYHPASKTIHSDDTLMYLQLPRLARALGLGDSVSFHPTLAKALETRPGASEDFRNWARLLFKQWGGAQNLCAAHTGSLLAVENTGEPLTERLQAALVAVADTLAKHEHEHG